jgi:hypothetical protein
MGNEHAEFQRRAIRHWYDDGIGEIVRGLLIGVVGLYLLLLGTVGRAWLAGALMAAGIPLLAIGGSSASRRMVRWLKDRVSLPRTGYVEYRRRTQKRRFAGIAVIFTVGALTGVILALIYNFWPRGSDLLPPAIAAVALSAGAFYIALRIRRLRFAVTAVVILGAAAAAIAADLGVLSADGIVLAAAGLSSSIGGVVALRGYLKRYPVGGESSDGTTTDDSQGSGARRHG